MAVKTSPERPGNSPLKVMLDTSVLAQAVTHTSDWVPKGVIRWGPQEIETGYLARVQRDFSLPDHRPFVDEVAALASLAAEAEKGTIEFFETANLRIERWRQPTGRFSGYGIFDRRLAMKIKLLPSDGGFMVGKAYVSKCEHEKRIRARTDFPFRRMLDVINNKHVLDTWHLHSCEINGIQVFLTLDQKFIE